MLQSQRLSTPNRILASLSPGDFGSLAPHLDPVDFKVRRVFFRPYEPIETVVFPESGFASVVATTESGRSLEVGIIGREGVIGVPVIFGQTLTPYNSYAQVAGAGFEIRADKLWDAMKQSWPLADILLKFAYAFLIQVTHSALANASFTTEQRMARWLLMAQDRVDDDEIPLTHEFLAMMLGTRRASVTEALQALGGRGAIDCKRRRIWVRDRPSLEEAAGDCYGLPESELARVGLLGASGGRRGIDRKSPLRPINRIRQPSCATRKAECSGDRPRCAQMFVYATR
jgi:CRP-like cAMP-binding protein